MRATFETPRDREAEKAVADECVRELVGDGAVAVKLPTFYEIDFAFVERERVMAFAEVKCRNIPRAKFPTLILSLHKWAALLRLNQPTAPAMLIVRWADGVGVVLVDEVKLAAIYWGGRSDRGDWQDREPVVHVPVAAFTVLS